MCGIYAIILANGGSQTRCTSCWRHRRPSTGAWPAPRARQPFGEARSLVDAISFDSRPRSSCISASRSPRQSGGCGLIFGVRRCGSRASTRAGGKEDAFPWSPSRGRTHARELLLVRATPVQGNGDSHRQPRSRVAWHNRCGLMASRALMISDVPYPAVPSIGFNGFKNPWHLAVAARSCCRAQAGGIHLPAMVATSVRRRQWMLSASRRSARPTRFWEREAEPIRKTMRCLRSPALAADACRTSTISPTKARTPGAAAAP